MCRDRGFHVLLLVPYYYDVFVCPLSHPVHIFHPCNISSHDVLQIYLINLEFTHLFLLLLFTYILLVVIYFLLCNLSWRTETFRFVFLEEKGPPIIAMWMKWGHFIQNICNLWIFFLSSLWWQITSLKHDHQLLHTGQLLYIADSFVVDHVISLPRLSLKNILMQLAIKENPSPWFWQLILT